MTTLRIPPERVTNLKKLAAMMNSQNISGVPVNRRLIECFDLVITSRENELLLKMGTLPRSREDLREISGMAEGEFEELLSQLMKKGLVWSRLEDEGSRSFTLAPILAGWFEIFLSDGQEGPEKQEFARRVDRYFGSFGKLNFFPLRNLMNLRARRQPKPHMRVVSTAAGSTAETVRLDLNEPLPSPKAKVYPAQTVQNLLNRYGDKGQIAVVHCFCRQWRKFVGEPCRQGVPSEACIVVGPMAEHAVELGIGRFIQKQEALDLVESLQKLGVVHQVFHEKESIDLPEMAVCNCCWDCCGVIGSYNRGIFPLRFQSYYLAKSDTEKCEGCSKCVKRCPVEAISLIDERSWVDDEKCIGCGQCSVVCPEGAIDMLYFERDVFLPLQKKSAARLA